MSETEIGWVIESSKDGDRWRFFGKGWTREGEPLLVHGASTFLRFRRLDEGTEEWSPPPQRNGDHPMTFLDLSAGTRLELWPADEHVGLPVLLPGGEEGRLLRFERSSDGARFTYALEFRGQIFRGPEGFRNLGRHHA